MGGGFGVFAFSGEDVFVLRNLFASMDTGA